MEHSGNRLRKLEYFHETPPATVRKTLAVLVQSIPKFLTAAVLFVSLLAFMSVSGCEYLETEGDDEAKILTPPSVREVIDDAEELGLQPLNLLRRRRDAAHRDLEELYDDRKDEGVNDRIITRLDAQLERARDRLDENYDRRKDRLRERMSRDES